MFLLRFLLLFSCFFPFVTFWKFGFDSQPWALLISVCILLVRTGTSSVRIPTVVAGFFITIAYGLLSIFLNIYFYRELDLFYALRSLFTVISLPLCFIAFHNSNFTTEELVKFLKAAVWIYFFVGLIQLAFPSFLTFLTARSSTSMSRGVYSLAPEPVEYSRTCIFLFVLLCLFRISHYVNKKTFNRLSVLLFVQGVIFSLSGTGFFWLVIIILIFVFNSGINKVRLLGFILLAVFLLSIFLHIGFTYYQDKRLFYLLGVAYENPHLLTKFGGFSLRVLNPVHSIYVGIFKFNALGVGFGFVEHNQKVDYSFLGAFFKGVKIYISSRAHGGLIGLVYEMGILAIPFILSFLKIISCKIEFTQNKINYSFIFYTFLLVVIFDGPIANSMLALILASFIIVKKDLAANNRIPGTEVV